METDDEDLRLGTYGGKKKAVKPGKLRSLNKGMRRKGGGRKRDFPDQVNQLAAWISKERSHGHALPKDFIGKKFQLILVEEAERLLKSTKR